jgi:hypothetical protein
MRAFCLFYRRASQQARKKPVGMAVARSAHPLLLPLDDGLATRSPLAGCGVGGYGAPRSSVISAAVNWRDSVI